MVLNRVLLLLFSVLGIIASLVLPWVHYPKVENQILYGRMGDGVLTAFLFFLSGLIILFHVRKPVIKRGWLVFMTLSGLALSLLAYNKVESLEDQKTNFQSENPVFDVATAGFYQGSGLYLMGIAGLGVFLLSLILLLDKQAITTADNKSFINSQTLGLASLLLCGVLAFILVGPDISVSKDVSEIKESITKGVEGMGQALINEDIETFISYNHPNVVQSFGGKEKMTELMTTSVQELKLSGNIIQDISLEEILDVEKDGNNIQALVTQRVEAELNGERKTEIQNIIAISEDNGSTWYFINTYDNSREKLEKVFPQLNPKLQF
jgi:hypothetical protein